MKKIIDTSMPSWDNPRNKAWTITVNDLRKQFRLHRVTKDDLVITTKKELARHFMVASNLNEVSFQIPYEAHLVFATTIKNVSVNDDEKLEVTLVATSDKDSAQLWRLFTWLCENAHEDVEPTSQCEILPKEENLKSIPERGNYSENARKARLEFIREHTDEPLDSLDQTSLAAEHLTGNIENLISGVEVPVGLAGPLLIRGRQVNEVIYAPMATTEGALVASVTRGAKALSLAGGVRTEVISQRMMRVPLFVFHSTDNAIFIRKWILAHASSIAEQVGKVSRHAKLIALNPTVAGRSLHVSFVYETGDAAGQNMTTATTWHACQWILSQISVFEHIQLKNFVIEANLSGDKKVNYKSFIEGRGTRVVADCVIPGDVIHNVLKVNPKQLINTFNEFRVGSVQSGMVGFNINIANTIAAMFTAMGQDIACVHESSIGELNILPQGDGIYCSMLLPSLIVGSIGGGTGLAKQQDFLKMIGCHGNGKSWRLAEIIAAYCLALDLSTLSAISNGTFAVAHERLGRNRPINWFEEKDLNVSFLQENLTTQCLSANDIASFERHKDTPIGSSIITELTSRNIRKLVGLFGYTLTLQSGRSIETIVKSKPVDQEVILMLSTMASNCGDPLSSYFNKFKHKLGFDGCHQREVEIYRCQDERFLRHVPMPVVAYINPEREAYVMVMENVEHTILKDSADEPALWSREHIETVLSGAAELHSIWLDDEDNFSQTIKVEPFIPFQDMIKMKNLWISLVYHGKTEFPEWYDPDFHRKQEDIINGLESWYGLYEAQRKTLVHNDFNPRNLFLRVLENDETRLCVYDWELATVNSPFYDVAEFLIFTLNEATTAEELEALLTGYKAALEKQANTQFEKGEANSAFLHSLYLFAIQRLPLYIMAHTFRDYKFVEHIFRTCHHLIRLVEDNFDDLSYKV